MQFLLTDHEVLEAIRLAVRRDDGMLLIDIPASCFQEGQEHRPTLTFLPESHVVHWGRRSVRLSPALFSLLQYVHQYHRVTFEAAQDAVWEHEMSDEAIRKSCSRLSSRLLDAEIPFSLFTRHGSIILEEATS